MPTGDWQARGMCLLPGRYKQWRAMGDAEQPLVEKGREQESEEPDPHTILALLRYSAADTPLLLVAFTAGDYPPGIKLEFL